MGFGAALVSGGLNVLNDAYNIYANERARADQLEAQHKNEELLRESWARDDSARQRMVTDLENAGLSKWLATGASPSGSSPISIQSPGSTALDGHTADSVMHAWENKMREAQTEAQTALQEKQGELADASTAVAEAEQKIKEEELRRVKAQADTAEHDAEVWSNRPGIASNDPAYMKAFGEGSNILSGNSKAGGRVGQAVQRGIKIASDSSPAIALTVGAVKGAKHVAGKVKDFFSGKDKTLDVPENKPLNYSTWLKKNGKKRSDETKREYDSYFENFYK